MVATSTTICNQALDALGKPHITALGVDGTLEDDLCNAAYEEVRDEVLRLHPWNVITKRIVLGENLLIQSDDFTDAAWTATNATVTADQIRAPDGTLTADLLTDADAGNAGTVAQAVTVPNNSKQFERDIFVFQGTAAVTRLLIAFTGGTGASQAIDITWAATPAISAGTIEDVGGGWWRVKVNLANTGAGDTTCTVTVYPAGATASATGTVYVWRDQLSQNSGSIGAVKTTTAAIRPIFPPYGYRFGWPLPADFIAILDVNDGDLQYKLEDGFLLYNAAEVPIRYLYQNTDADALDPLLREVIALRIAKRLAIPLGGSDERKREIKADLRDVEAKAATRDAQEDGEDTPVEDDWITGRFSGGGFGAVRRAGRW